MARRGGSSVWPSAMQQIISQPNLTTTHQSILPKPEIESAEQVRFVQQSIKFVARNCLPNMIEVLSLKVMVYRKQQQ